MSTLSWRLVVAAALCQIFAAQAQISTDGTLGRAVTLDGPDMLIPNHLGQQHGANLFHSFSHFGIDVGESATFTSDFTGETRHIISRVTGGHPSQINGLLRSTIPGADLWLLNPTGIAFGPSATLDLPASLHLSTGHTVELTDANFFAADPGIPGQLLTAANPSFFGYVNAPVGDISIRGSRLIVAAGRDMTLAGGDIHVSDQAVVASPQGRLNLLALDPQGSESGSIKVEQSVLSAGGNRGGLLQLQAGNIQISGGSSLDVVTLDQNGGDLILRADEIEILSSSQVGTFSRGTGEAGSVLFVGSRSGSAAEQVNIDGSLVVSIAGTDEQPGGTTGNVEIYSRDIRVSDSRIVVDAREDNGGSVGLFATQAVLETSLVGTNTLGKGDAGNVLISASEQLTLTQSQLSSVSFGTGEEAGRTGSVLITSTDLHVNSEVLLSTRTVGGDGGNIVVNANNADLGSGTQLDTATAGPGSAGNIILSVDSLRASNLEVSSQTTGTGKAGSINFRGRSVQNAPQPAQSIELTNSVVDSQSSSLHKDAGDGGDIEFATLALSLNGVAINADTSGAGNAGAIRISGNVGTGEPAPTPPQRLILKDSTLSTDSISPGSNAGTAGTISLRASHISLTDSSQLSSTTLTGEGGEIRLEVAELTVMDSAINGVTAGSGNAATIEIVGLDGPARRVELLLSNGGELSGVSSSSTARGDNAGQAGELVIRAQQLLITDGAIVGVDTVDGAGGNIVLAVDDLEMSGTATAGPEQERGLSRIDLSTAGSGEAGSLVIHGSANEHSPTQTVVLSRGSALASNSRSNNMDAGSAGRILINVQSLALDGNSFLSIANRTGAGGLVEIHADTIHIAGDAFVSTTSLGRGDAGNTILTGLITDNHTATPAQQVQLDSGRIFSASLFPADGAGAAGDIRISAIALDVRNNSEISVESLGPRLAGGIEISAQSLELQDSAIRASAAESAGGNIELTIGELMNTIDADIEAVAQGLQPGDRGGNIAIESTGAIAINRSRIRADANAGSGGNIRIGTETFVPSTDSRVTASSRASLDGVVQVESVNNISGTLLEVPPPEIEIPRPLQGRCTPDAVNNRSSLEVLEGMPEPTSSYLSLDGGLEGAPPRLSAFTPTPCALFGSLQNH